MKRFHLFVLAGAWALAMAGQEVPEVSVTISPRTATVGDRIEIRAIVKTSQQFDWVENTFKTEGVDILRMQVAPPKRLKQTFYYEHIVTAALFRTGAFPLGPFEVAFVKDNQKKGSRTVEAQTITVQSVLKREDTDIAPLKQPISISGNPLYLLKYAAILLLLFSGLALFWILRRKKGATAQASTPSGLHPEEELAHALSELLSMPWLQRGEYRKFFILLSEIWKRFLQRHYLFPAEDFTTYETLDALRYRETDPRISEGIRWILETSDHVKFAKMVPAVETVDILKPKVNELLGEYRKRMQDKMEELHAAAGE